MNKLKNVKSFSVDPKNQSMGTILADATSLDIVQWTRENRNAIDELLIHYPALLLRGFHAISPKDFLGFCKVFSTPMDYIYQSTPRTKMEDGLYTATEYPPTESIPQHCENAYQNIWPMKLFFWCEKAAESGGETPLADVRKVTSDIPAEIIEMFREKKVMYVRNYRPGLDIPWQTVFQTSDKSVVEKYCSKNHIKYEWVGGQGLRTSQVCQGTAHHPLTGEELWFNQTHLFHASNLDDEIRNSLLSIYSEKDLPRNAYYGDGTPIENEVLTIIRKAFEVNKHIFPWENNDILLVDNMLCSHGRNPYSGARSVFVAMGTPSSWYS